jgi:hypothetical protein
LETPLPAENSARSTPAKLSAPSASTGSSAPRNRMLRPAERGEATSRSEARGKPRCFRLSSSATPTAPVAPTMATCGVAARV